MIRLLYVVSVALCSTPLAASPVTSIDDSDYIATAITAAPERIGKNATVARVNDQFVTTMLQKWINKFTCGIEPDTGNPFCADAGAMAWYRAFYNMADPPDKSGLVYILGDTSTSDQGPVASTRSRPVVAGPHLMFVGKAAREMADLYLHIVDAAPTQVYVIFPGTKYEHLMMAAERKPHAVDAERH